MTKSESQIKKGSVGNPCYGSAVNPVETELPTVLVGVQWSPVYFCWCIFDVLSMYRIQISRMCFLLSILKYFFKHCMRILVQPQLSIIFSTCTFVSGSYVKIFNVIFHSIYKLLWNDFQWSVYIHFIEIRSRI